MEKKLFKSVFIPSVKIKSSDSDKTVFEVVGIPYGGPEYLNGKDLHGERFTKNTDYGKDLQGNVVVNTIYAFYDHALNDVIGRDQIGYAKFFQETDEGQVWEIEVMRAYRYHDMLLALAQKNLLGASSQPVQTAVEIDYESGEIKRWYPAEISLTPTPANPNAVAQVMKSFNMEYKVEDVVEEELNKKPEDDKVEDQDTPELDLASEIEDAFADTPEGELLTDVKSTLAALVADVAAIKTALNEAKEADTKTAANVVSLALEVGKINAGLKTFALQVAKTLKSDMKKVVVDLEKKSGVEADVEDEVDEEHRQTPPVKSVIPQSAPGMRKVN